MPLVKYIGGYRRVYVPEAGLSVEKGNSITVSSGVASSLLLQVGTWEAGDKEPEELAPPPSPAVVPPGAAQKKVSIGTAHAPMTVNTNFTTDGVLTKYKIKHGLASNNVTVTVQTHAEGVAKEVTTVSKIVAISAEEI